jgi:hypothetical protein
MPTHVTNKIKAPSHVIAALLNDEGNVDFNRIIKFDGEFPWDDVSMDAEQMAEMVTGKGVDDHPLIAALQQANRARASIKQMSDITFEQFVQMLRNYRKCDVFHHMDFARQNWGTKWNAYSQSVDVAAGAAKFDTAWSCPKPVLEALSKRFPEDTIEVQYADEDIGSNCGSYSLKDGLVVASDIAPNWGSQSDEQKAKWRAFAFDVTGREPSADEDE